MKRQLLLYGLVIGGLVLAWFVPSWIYSYSVGQDSVKIQGQVVFGVITDTHIDGSRGRTNTLRSIVGELNKFNLDFVIELGDAVEGDTSESIINQQWQLFESAYAKLKAARYYVRGNHEVIRGDGKISDQNRQAAINWQEKTIPNPPYYSFDVKGYHFVVLEIPLSYPLPAGELEWLKQDLANTPYKTIVFSHRPIVWNPAVMWFKDPDVDPTVRQALEQSGKVLACFNGHGHKDVQGVTLNGIDYYLVPSPAFSGGAPYVGNLPGKYFVVSITGDKVGIDRRSIK